MTIDKAQLFRNYGKQYVLADPNFAKAYGLTTAYVYGHIRFLLTGQIKNNTANDTIQLTLKELNSKLMCMSPKTIRRALSVLEEEGWLIIGHSKKDKNTCTYKLGDPSEQTSLSQFGQNDQTSLVKMTKGIGQNDQTENGDCSGINIGDSSELCGPLKLIKNLKAKKDKYTRTSCGDTLTLNNEEDFIMDKTAHLRPRRTTTPGQKVADTTAHTRSASAGKCRPKRTTVPGQHKYVPDPMRRFTPAEIQCAQEQFEYYKSEWREDNKSVTWENSRVAWCKGVHCACNYYTIEEIQNALRWSRTQTGFCKDVFRSTAQLTKRTKAGMLKIEMLMEHYRKAHKTTQVTPEVLRNLVETELMTADCPKKSFDTELQKLSEDLVSIKDWLHDINMSLPPKNRDNFYLRQKYLEICRQLVHKRFDFSTYGKFAHAVNEVIGVAEAKAEERPDSFRFGPWVLDPDTIIPEE